MAKKEEALAPVAPAALEARPSFLPAQSTRGTEDLTRDDIQMPRIGLAQQMSPELAEDNPKYIDGLKQGYMFNSVTGEIIGKGPITFTVARCDRPRYIEFIPRELGGGVKDPNVPPNDPRTQFGPNGETPVATKFYDFIIVRTDTPQPEVIALSLKSTGLKVAKQLNALMKLRNADIFAGQYSLMSVKEKNAKGEYYNFSVKNAGWVTEEQYKFAQEVYEALKNKDIAIDREAHETVDGDASFDTTSM